MKQYLNYNLKNNIFLIGFYNLLVVLALFMISRVTFYFVNYDAFTCVTFNDFLLIVKGGFMFDITAILYLNLLYLLMMIIPFHFRYHKSYLQIAKWIFIITNSVGLIANSVDMIYFKFTNRRTTATVFSEFSNEGNLGKVFLDSMFEYWYVVLFTIGIIFVLIKAFYEPESFNSPYKEEKKEDILYPKYCSNAACNHVYNIWYSWWNWFFCSPNYT